MKTNTIQTIISGVVAGIVAGIGSTNLTGDFPAGLAITVGYLVVVALVALAVADYRRQRSYTV